MTQLALLPDHELHDVCRDCGQPLRDLYTPGVPPPAPWDQDQDWRHGAVWLICPCSPRTPRGCRPAPDPRTVAA